MRQEERRQVEVITIRSASLGGSLDVSLSASWGLLVGVEGGQLIAGGWPVAPSRTHCGVGEVPSDNRGVTTGRRMTNNGVSDKEVEGTQRAQLAASAVQNKPRAKGTAGDLLDEPGWTCPFVVLAFRLKPGAGSLVSPCSVCR